MEREVEEVTFRGEESELTTESDFWTSSSSSFEDSPAADPDSASSADGTGDHHFYHHHHHNNPDHRQFPPTHEDSPIAEGHNMYFHTDFGDTIFFKDWITSSHLETFYVCIAFFMYAIIYEALKSYRKTLIFKKNFRSDSYAVAAKLSANGLGSNPIGEDAVSSECHEMKPWLKEMFSMIHGINTLIHTTQIAMGYILMLAVMTFNLWIIMSILLGSAVGFFIFGWKRRASSSADSCESSIPSSSPDNSYVNKGFAGF